MLRAFFCALRGTGGRLGYSDLRGDSHLKDIRGGEAREEEVKCGIRLLCTRIEYDDKS